ncbi:keratin-associated protein 10-2-like [Dendronephthya gigantea]|uniref:keratin-associated protein 10-2-like n=1 Tax=Dendronephthya gigantea TaxID=151771 RepID=UPI00106DA8CD|nr:keratin-associated protein 10-2-like [Dendronephthya gigantea]
MTLVVTTTQALFLISLISVVYGGKCTDDKCEKACYKTCDGLDCGNSKECVQLCIGRSCSSFTCETDSCTQTCMNCTSKMVCNSNNCLQICKGSSCEMECGPKTKVCKQVCQTNSTCKLTCDKAKSKCENSCEGAECTGLEKEPKQVSSCDESTKNCTRSCTGNCKGRKLSCLGNQYEECRLSCENGCNMKCDSKVKNCYQTCIGDTECSSICDASNCVIIGKIKSSAMVCKLNSLVSAFISCLMIILGGKL